MATEELSASMNHFLLKIPKKIPSTSVLNCLNLSSCRFYSSINVSGTLAAVGNLDNDYDVVVVGGGHAGTEAAAASARMGVRTLLVTHKMETIGEMSCNPAFGGIGKGHLIKEIDALDGVCGRACDETGVFYKMLNTRKGPAVWGPRAQIDRDLYKKRIQSELGSTPNLTILAAPVEDLVMANPEKFESGRTKSCCQGIILKNGEKIRSRCVVLTTGTFLRGEIVIGLEVKPAGRIGDEPSIGLAKTLADVGFQLGRLKTGTPPRLDKSTVDFSKMTPLSGDEKPVPFSFMNDKVWIEPSSQMLCYLTQTNQKVADLILSNLHLNRVVIKGTTGPRYCPSIESKILRFGDKRHQVWIEPEGLNSNLVYPQGLSCTMPAAIQQQMINLIPGLESAKIVRPGYGVEYDFVDPRQIRSSLETHSVENLFFAGQINGTTGYEEAAAQGLVAGVNAALKARNKPAMILSRTESYIGVMIDDLTSRGATEPYRMFTSRAEFRTHLRPDNADLRLTEKGHTFGCVREHRYVKTKTIKERLRDAGQLTKSFERTVAQWRKDVKLHHQQSSMNSSKVSAFDCLSGHLPFEKLAEAYPETFGHLSTDPQLCFRLKLEAMYSNALELQMEEMEELRRDEMLLLPDDIDYNILHISMEAKEKLSRLRPETIAAASRIQGITPATVIVLLRYAQNKIQRTETLVT